MVKRKKLICVTGLPGAGKSLFCEIGKRLGYELEGPYMTKIL